jgi:hypothetical protein
MRLLLGSLSDRDESVAIREGGTWGSVRGSRACGPCLVMFGLVHTHLVWHSCLRSSYPIVVACFPHNRGFLTESGTPPALVDSTNMIQSTIGLSPCVDARIKSFTSCASSQFSLMDFMKVAKPALSTLVRLRQYHVCM